MTWKIGIVQPPYPNPRSGPTPAEAVVYALNEVERAGGACDLILLPEYANCPGVAGREALADFVGEPAQAFLRRLGELARAKRTNLAANVLLAEGSAWRNVTVLFDRTGRRLAEYAKTHLTGPEADELRIVPGGGARVIEVDGVRAGFLTCVEAYFAEYVERLADLGPDLVLFPSYQRSEDADVIRRQAAGRALDLEAFLVRASYAMGQASRTGGGSLVADPRGEILLDAGQRAGLFTCEIDPKAKRIRPASHGRAKLRSREAVEPLRRPELYRPAGPGTGRPEQAPFPRLVAHRGLSGLCPENTLPAFGAAVALGVEEIELDVWGSKDGELVVCHDDALDRTTTGSGRIGELDWPQLARLDAGVRFGENWRNIRLPRLEDVFAAFAGRVVMNIHLKEPGRDGWVVGKTAALAAQYGIARQVYLAGLKDVLVWAAKLAGDIDRCCLEGQHDMTIVDRAVELGCRRVQFWNPRFTAEMVEKAHRHGIRCNVFYADTEAEARRCLDLGVDALLTNFANRLIPLRGTGAR